MTIPDAHISTRGEAGLRAAGTVAELKAMDQSMHETDWLEQLLVMDSSQVS